MCGCHHGCGPGYGYWDHGCGPGYGYGYGRGLGYGPRWASRPTRDEFVEELEAYKADLEAEIQSLERRLQTLRSKQE